MKVTRNLSVLGENDRPLVYDVFDPQVSDKHPVILFCHGFKGFKDWGAWDLMCSAFAKAGYLTIKFNYSHNGGTLKQPIDFPDLEAFGNNNYSIELRDTTRMLDLITSSNLPIDHDHITIMGHSRAGGITTITAAKDKRVKKLITLAGVADYKSRFPSGTELKDWENKGVMYIKNGRTQQEMPLYYQFYQDFIAHENELTILDQATRLNCPHLIIHGTLDPTVSINEAYRLKQANSLAEMALINGANHVFGAVHPWNRSNLPNDLQRVVQCSLNFLNK
ncbi:alpha/beta fold hydrolase [Nonlabens tegetincola]|uniref:alpha/beta hydrolase family protein n=1 Tax=Nonlabens tegetincola TaxID=323273 RepID=UPI0030C7BF68